MQLKPKHGRLIPLMRRRSTGSPGNRLGCLLLAAFVSFRGAWLAFGLFLFSLTGSPLPRTSLTDPLTKADLNAIGDLDPHLVLGSPMTFPMIPPGGHNRVAALHRVDHGLMLLHLLLLRPEHQKIENDRRQE